MKYTHYVLMICAYMIQCAAQGMENKSDDQQLKIYAIPGLGNIGSESAYVRSLFEEYNPDIVSIETPSAASDLGQEKCIRIVADALEADKDSKALLIHATSQGTATILNYLARGDGDQRIKALILEAPLTSGNNGIAHILSGKLGKYGPVMWAPLAYYWVPYLACLFRFKSYAPAGVQVIKSIPQIPLTIPIVMVHAREDQIVSYKDSCALYYGLKHHNNKSVYFISKPGERHTQVLEASDKDALHAILKKHAVLPAANDTQTIDVTQYQPDHRSYASLYNELLKQEKIRERIEQGLDAATIIAGIAMTYWALKTVLKKKNHLNQGFLLVNAMAFLDQY